MTNKAETRRALRRARTEFTARADVVDRLLVLTLMAAEHAAPVLAGARTAAFYVSNGVEVDPLPLLFRAIDAGIDTVLPRIAEDGGALTFHLWVPGDDLVPGPMGLVQPRRDAPRAEPDLIFAPLVGFDRALNRIGQGGGHYDRTFAALPAARRIGLAWSVQEMAAIEPDLWDVPLHGIATEREWIGAA
ncbi:MAG: 5-formyltetrahydrofolate cyclo-ligase [Sphingomonas fennica]